MSACPLDRCDGSGMLDIYFLKTVKTNGRGSCFVERQPITRAQFLELERKVDFKTQFVETAAKTCGCKTGAVQ